VGSCQEDVVGGVVEVELFDEVVVVAGARR